MKKIILLILMLSQIAFAQTSANRYEAELLKNPNKGGKDTREVNAVLVFEKDALKIISRRKKETFKEFKYSEIKYVEHSYSKEPFFSNSTRTMMLSMLTGLPFFLGENEKHWLTVVTENDFAVLKIENDNFRLLKNEFLIRKFDLVNINENR
ncbi:MAG TPA: hypothetical protein VNB22_23080 [Pyrinomonadaceae bacterium]|nr:hypothetical protein [Pyrinomonadaceae bacterium]